MRSLLALALLAVSVIPAHAMLWGTTLAEPVVYTSTYTGVGGIASGNAGVTDAACAATQLNALVVSSPSMFAQSSQGASSIFFSVKLHAFWLANDGPPPNSLYMNKITTPQVNVSLLIDPGSLGQIAGAGWASASTQNESGNTAPGYTNISKSKAVVVRQSTLIENIEWDAIGTRSGHALYRTRNPVQVVTPTASAEASVYCSWGSRGSVTALCNSGLGHSYRFSTQPLP